MDGQTKTLFFRVACSELHSALSKRLTHSHKILIQSSFCNYQEMGQSIRFHLLIVHLLRYSTAIRSDCPLPCFNSFIFYHPFHLIVIYYRFAVAVRPLVGLIFPKGNRLLSNSNAGVPPRVSCKKSFLRLSSVFSASALSDCFRHLWRQKNKSQRSQTG